MASKSICQGPRRFCELSFSTASFDLAKESNSARPYSAAHGSPVLSSAPNPLFDDDDEDEDEVSSAPQPKPAPSPLKPQPQGEIDLFFGGGGGGGGHFDAVGSLPSTKDSESEETEPVVDDVAPPPTLTPTASHLAPREEDEVSSAQAPSPVNLVSDVDFLFGGGRVNAGASDGAAQVGYSAAAAAAATAAAEAAAEAAGALTSALSPNGSALSGLSGLSGSPASPLAVVQRQLTSVRSPNGSALSPASALPVVQRQLEAEQRMRRGNESRVAVLHRMLLREDDGVHGEVHIINGNGGGGSPNDSSGAAVAAAGDGDDGSDGSYKTPGAVGAAAARVARREAQASAREAAIAEREAAAAWAEAGTSQHCSQGLGFRV